MSAEENALAYVIEQAGLKIEGDAGDDLATKWGFTLEKTDNVNMEQVKNLELPEDIRELIM